MCELFTRQSLIKFSFTNICSVQCTGKLIYKSPTFYAGFWVGQFQKHFAFSQSDGWESKSLICVTGVLTTFCYFWWDVSPLHKVKNLLGPSALLFSLELYYIACTKAFKNYERMPEYHEAALDLKNDDWRHFGGMLKAWQRGTFCNQASTSQKEDAAYSCQVVNIWVHQCNAKVKEEQSP